MNEELTTVEETTETQEAQPTLDIDALRAEYQATIDESRTEIERLNNEIAARNKVINDLIDQRHTGGTADTTIANIKKMLR